METSTRAAAQRPLAANSLRSPLKAWVRRVLSGTLINSPNWLRAVSKGDHDDATLERLGDWMFAISSKVYGGHTVNLIRSRMSPSERKAHDRAWGLQFGDPSSVSLVHVSRGRSTVSGLLGRLRLGPSADRPAEVAALLDHPMSLNSEESLRQELTANPELVHQPDERGWTLLHHEALAGNRNIVRLLLELGADATVRTPDGQSVLDLARILKWHTTMEVLSRSPEQPH